MDGDEFGISYRLILQINMKGIKGMWPIETFYFADTKIIYGKLLAKLQLWYLQKLMTFPHRE